MKIAVTGGAGFIGSHTADYLIRKGHDVSIIDNFSSGLKENINSQAKLFEKNVASDDLECLRGMDAVFHMAASPDVRSSADSPEDGFRNNVLATFNTLEACRKLDIKQVVFASTSTVYGEVDVIPTPEDYPTKPISNYGASKLACEAYLSSYSSSYGIKATVLRYANIYGERSTHGVAFDFYHKLKKNSEVLEILGDGKQEKSYLHIDDCISASIAAFEKQSKLYDVFNVGSSEKNTVDEIAKLVSRRMGLSPEFSYTGTTRGWVGDVRVMLLSTKKIGSLGWSQKVSLQEGIGMYVDWLSRS